MTNFKTGYSSFWQLSLFPNYKNHGSTPCRFLTNCHSVYYSHIRENARKFKNKIGQSQLSPVKQKFKWLNRIFRTNARKSTIKSNILSISGKTGEPEKLQLVIANRVNHVIVPTQPIVTSRV